LNRPTWKPQRVDDPKHYKVGWFAAVWIQGKCVKTKLFSDSKYGKRKGKHAAQAWLDEYRENHVPKKIRQAWDKEEKHGMAYKNKGVHLSIKAATGVESWIGSYRHEGKTMRKQFSVQKYGYRKAKQLAQEFRDQGIARKLKR